MSSNARSYSVRGIWWVTMGRRSSPASRSSAIRSSGDLPAFLFEDVSPYKKGEDVLIDILPLSRCDHLLKCAASAGEYALWFNPDLSCTDFALKSRWTRANATPAYLKLNVGGLHSAHRGALIAIRRLRVGLLDRLMRLGRALLPSGLRDWLWKRAGQRLYFPKGRSDESGG